jgi:hypothetical protein
MLPNLEAATLGFVTRGKAWATNVTIKNSNEAAGNFKSMFCKRGNDLQNADAANEKNDQGPSRSPPSGTLQTAITLLTMDLSYILPHSVSISLVTPVSPALCWRVQQLRSLCGQRSAHHNSFCFCYR